MQVQALSPTMNAVNGRLLIFSGNVVSLMAAQSFVPPGAAADTAENLQFASQIAFLSRRPQNCGQPSTIGHRNMSLVHVQSSVTQDKGFFFSGTNNK